MCWYTLCMEIFLIPIICLGLIRIAIDSFQHIRRGEYSLDYIAAAAMVLSLVTGEYIAGAVIAVMFLGGEALERYATRKASSSLSQLAHTIPKTCAVRQGDMFVDTPLQSIHDGSIILVKHQEIIPLDGVVVSPRGALLDTANLTGESDVVEVVADTSIKSGVINKGEAFEMRVTGDFTTSTYHKIVEVVEKARTHPARMVRLSARANAYFTGLSVALATCAYVYTGELGRVLAVLVIATPCPLIIAAPVAFVSGMSRAAKAGIIVRKPSALESIDSATTFFFDKTGTLTLGEPALVSKISDIDLRIAAALEIHSLHPRARTIVAEARRRNVAFPVATDVHEEIGKGISGRVDGAEYKFDGTHLMRGDATIANFAFSDVMKHGSADFITTLAERGATSALITGDTLAHATNLFNDTRMKIYAEQTPADKMRLVREAQQRGEVVAMIGDGVNDAPALATANVGIVFSGSENGAAIEAADIAVLGSGIDRLEYIMKTSRRTMSIARQSVYGGIALSTIGMVFAALGYINPVVGAFIQEAIDVTVILNALRILL